MCSSCKYMCSRAVKVCYVLVFKNDPPPLPTYVHPSIGILYVLDTNIAMYPGIKNVWVFNASQKPVQSGIQTTTY